MYRIATMAKGPNAAMLSGVKAETTDEKMRAGRPTCWQSQHGNVECHRSQVPTRLRMLTPLPYSGGNPPLLVMT